MHMIIPRSLVIPRVFKSHLSTISTGQVIYKLEVSGEENEVHFFYDFRLQYYYYRRNVN